MSEQIIRQSVEEEITQSYIDYAMSVIVSRALPDVRDWLKPVQRRILYAMYDMKLLHNTKFKKSAAVVWEVLWKYHPHGDSSVYEALVRMAQPFSLRYPLIDWQWNFWSIDWDWAAAMRYTEVRLTKIAEEMLEDINQDTVDWRDNYDNSRKEPTVLPTKFPDHLCNGTMGIAVWMATNMAPNNLNEVLDACLLLIEKPDSDINTIMGIIKWPDFPTWWIIFNSEWIKEVYSRWKWWIVMRWKVHFENMKWHDIIVIDELPYQVNKANLVAKIWELVNERKIDWITDITDESNKSIIRITINIRKWAWKDDILTQLYKFTDLQSNFNLNNVILIDNWLQPRLLNIKELLEEFIKFRRQVILRRSKYLLEKAQDRLHILEWLKKAIDILDEVIATIRWSQTRQEAKDKLINNFEFSEPQAEYILMLRLQTLVWLEIQKILDEINEKKEIIEYLLWIINDTKKLDWVVIDEIVYMKTEYWDKRRTEISNDVNVFALDSSMRNLMKQADLRKENIICWLWNNFELKVLYQSRVNILPDDTFSVYYTHNQDQLVAISDIWELVIQRLKDIGSHVMKWKWFEIKYEYNLKWNLVFADMMWWDFDYLLLLTDKNNIKKVKKELLESLRKFPTIIMWLENDEKIVQVMQVKTGHNIWILSKEWMLLMFNETNVRASWKTAWWVKWINLQEGDNVANMFPHKDEMFIFVYSDQAWKLVALEDLKMQKRWQAWLKIAELTDWEKIMWGMSIEEWAVRIQLANHQVIDIHSNDIKLKNRLTKLDKLTDHKIKRIYRPWEEETTKWWKDNNEQENINQKSLFDKSEEDNNDNKLESNNDKTKSSWGKEKNDKIKKALKTTYQEEDI